MSPFKEPQPRKNSAAEDAKTVIGGNWPPYARQGGEATWEECPPEVSETPLAELAQTPDAQRRMQEWANEPQPPLMVVPDHTSFMARTAALEAAVKYAEGTDWQAQRVVSTADIFENYLRNGKPS